jgi:putative ABC transport system substrate-binding protein
MMKPTASTKGELTMQRRHVIAALGSTAIAAAAGPAWAQERRPARIGFIGGGEPSESRVFLSDLTGGLLKLGYDRARFAVIERFAERQPERIQALVEELEALGVDLIVTHAAAVSPVVRARRTAPVVYQLSADPVSVGLAAELSKPQFNATGLTLMAAELNGKRLELAREFGPDWRRLAVIYSPLHPGEHLERAWIDYRAKALGFDVEYFAASNKDALRAALGKLGANPPEVALILSDVFMLQEHSTVLGGAAILRLPVFAGWAAFAEGGALCSYGPRISEVIQRAAVYVDRILRGAKPVDLPIERPSLFELVINLETAAKLGLSTPSAVLARADRVIG